MLDCGCCCHFSSSSTTELYRVPGYCAFHEQHVAECSDFRVCIQFIANDTYWADNQRCDSDGIYHRFTPYERLVEFEQKLEPGVLYSYACRGRGCLRVFQEMRHEVVDEHHPRRRLEAALLTETPFESLWTVLKDLKAEGLPKRHVLSLLAEYAAAVSGVASQHSALLRAIAILNGRLPAPD